MRFIKLQANMNTIYISGDWTLRIKFFCSSWAETLWDDDEEEEEIMIIISFIRDVKLKIENNGKEEWDFKLRRFFEGTQLVLTLHTPHNHPIIIINFFFGWKEI